MQEKTSVIPKAISFLAKYCTGDATSNLVRAFKAKVKPGGPKFKFGVQVPMGVKQAVYLDKKTGTPSGKTQSGRN